MEKLKTGSRMIAILFLASLPSVAQASQTSTMTSLFASRTNFPKQGQLNPTPRLASAWLAVSGSFSDSINGYFGPNTASENDFVQFKVRDGDAGVHASRNAVNGPASLAITIGVDWTPASPAIQVRVTNPDGSSSKKTCWSGNSCSTELAVQSGTNTLGYGPIPFLKLLPGHYVFTVTYQDGTSRILEFEAN